MAVKILCLLVISVILTKNNVEGSKLNVPRVLLPIFNKFAINFTLEVTDGGCYKWTTSRLDIVQLTPIYENEQECSSRAIVSSISKETVRNTAIVLAEEQYTGHVLRCDVIVDVISTLDIVTTTRELYMEEAPEAFEVRAYDDQGNEFTTLENIQFDWAIKCTGSDTSDLSVLRFIPFRDSPYETPKSVELFEELGLRGHIVLLEGIKTGSAKVSVKLPYPEYTGVKLAQVSLMVVANLLVEPADVYIIRGDTIQYRIIQVKHGRLEEIELASSQYYLKVDNPKIGEIDPKTGLFTSLADGKAKIILHDRNVDFNSELKLPSTNVIVTYPSSIALSIAPNKNWAVLLGEQHEVSVEIYAKNDHRIYIGKGVQFETTVNEGLFPVDRWAQNASWFSGVAKGEGSAEVRSRLISINSKFGTVAFEPSLSVINEILIYPPITLTPNEVLLPWDPQTQPKYEVEIVAGGGDGKFIWTSSNHTIGTVTQTGLAHTYFHGRYDVCASMCRNPKNKRCSRIFITPPVRLEIYEYTIENEIGSPIFLHVALYGRREGSSTLNAFHKCDKLSFRVKPSETSFMYNRSASVDPIGIACQSVAIVGLSVGVSRISVSYVGVGYTLEDNITVSAYNPLKILFPESAESTLALGSSRNVIFTGGPRPWQGRLSDHSYRFDTNNSDVIEIRDRSNRDLKDYYVVEVVCKDLGEAQINLTVVNKPLCRNCKHHSSWATVTIFCSEPYFLGLSPEISFPEGELCPMTERVVVQSYRDIFLNIVVKDDFGRVFDNITSLNFAWGLNPSRMGVITHKFLTRNTSYDGVLLPDGFYQTVAPHSESGTIEIGAKILAYNVDALRGAGVRLRDLEVVKTKLNLYLVDDTIITPNYTSVYNHPENKFYIDVKQGSGFYELALSSESIARIRYLDQTRQIEVIPQNNGELQIRVHDLCLMSKPATITLKVVSIASIDVEMSDKVQIGKTILARVKFYDETDQLMNLPNLEYLDLRYIIEDDIISVKLLENDPQNPWGVGEVHYLITGQLLGDTQLVFATGRGQEVISAPVPLQVFSPIKLSPKNTTLFVGAELQLSVSGGPADLHIEYLVNGQVVEIQGNGLVKALQVGVTKVIGRSVGVCPSTGQKLIHGEDFVEINVIPLTGVKISTPLTRFMLGTTIPVWLSGLPDQLSPLLLGSIYPPAQIDWVGCDLIELRGLYDHVGVRLKQVSIRLKGVKVGHCTLGVNVTVGGVTLFSSVDLEVFDELKLVAPSTCAENILLAPYSSLQLFTNLNGQSRIEYSFHTETHDDRSVQLPNSLISISPEGVLQSFGNIGRVMVIVSASDESNLKQTLTLVVQVKPIHYMMANLETDWVISGSLPYLPLGVELRFRMSYHDNTGKAFTAAKIDLKYRSNRFDLLEIKRVDNGLVTYPLREGGNVIKIWAESTTKMVDYIHVVAQSELTIDLETLNTGDVFCLRSNVVDRNFKSGRWHGDGNEAITIDPVSGIGQVLSDGRSTGVAFYSLTTASKVRMNIEPNRHVFIKYDRSHISNSQSRIRIPFLLTGERNRLTKRSNLLTPCDSDLEAFVRYFPYRCQLYFNNDIYAVQNVFEVQPGFDGESGLFTCDLLLTSAPNLYSSTILSNMTLMVTLNNQGAQEILDLVFKPAIYINTDNLIINDVNLEATLVVTGLPEILAQVKVEPMDSNILNVDQPFYTNKNTLKYNIQLIDYHWKFAELQYPLSLQVISKVTDQNVKVMIKTMLGHDFSAKSLCLGQNLGSPTGNFFYNNRHAIAIVISMLALFFLTVYAYAHYIQPVINVNVGPPKTIMNTSKLEHPLMLHSTPSRLNKSYGTAMPTLSRSTSHINNSAMSSLSNTTRFADISSDFQKSFNTSDLIRSDIRRNRRFL